MAIISNVRNDGRSFVTTGPKIVNSYNVYPSNLVATASGTTLHYATVANFDFFNVAQSSAGTDSIILNTSFPVGTEVWMFCVSACKVGTVASSGVGINGGTDAQLVTLAANSTYRFIKVSSTNIICNSFSSAGAIGNPVAA